MAYIELVSFMTFVHQVSSTCWTSSAAFCSRAGSKLFGYSTLHFQFCLESKLGQPALTIAHLSSVALCSQSDCGCGLCFLFSGQEPKCASTVKQFLEPASYVGGKCNGKMTNDPHLVGAHGTHFDFVGEPDRAFCVVSDKRLHINAGLKGYMDSNTKDAVLVKDGKAVHTWVKELGVVWTDESEEHTLKLVARSGPQAARGMGFLKGAEVDGKRLASPSVGQELVLPGGLKFKFVAREQNKKFEIDVFTVIITDLLEMELRLRAAEPALRTEDEAYVHLSMTFKTIKVHSCSLGGGSIQPSELIVYCLLRVIECLWCHVRAFWHSH